VDDAFFTAMVPSVIGAGGKVVLASSAGAPRGFFYRLLQNRDERMWVYESAVNDNPRANRSLIDRMRTRLALINPVAAARELDNRFEEDGEALVPVALIDGAVDLDLGERSFSDLQAYAFVDLSRKRDRTTVAVVTRHEPVRPEAADHLQLSSLRVWNPADEPMLVSDHPESAWQQCRGRSESINENHGDEVVEMTETEMLAAGGPDVWKRVNDDWETAQQALVAERTQRPELIPRSELRRRHANALVEIARREGAWMPQDR
jgi:hypothetical protein